MPLTPALSAIPGFPNYGISTAGKIFSFRELSPYKGKLITLIDENGKIWQGSFSKTLESVIEQKDPRDLVMKKAPRQKGPKKAYQKIGYRTRPVVQFDANGKFVAEFVSISDARRKTGLSVCNSLKGDPTNIRGGFYFRYKS